LSIPDLPLMEDIYGRVFVDSWHGDTEPYRIRRDDGHVEDGPCVSTGELAAAPPTLHQQALERAEGRVLDLGCGPGRHVLWLQRQGLDVVGIDASPRALQVARERGCRDVRLMPIEKLDFPPDSFDTAVFFGSTIGIGCWLDGIPQRLCRLRAIVRPRGRIIAQARDPEATDNPAHLAYHERRRQEGRYPGELRLRIEYRGHAGPWWDFTLVSPDALEAAAAEAGWQMAEFLGGPADGLAILVGT